MTTSAHQGRLRVYLGAAPGVGKTVAMLEEGHRRAERGTDVVIGYLEPHERPKTIARIGDLEIVPRQHLAYRGTSRQEMDLHAVIARRPQVALVDELAHSNVAGAGNAKRWQDIQALLDAGIDVVTTVNVQHLESVNDVVESITGVRQRETVPDNVVRRAEAIELVDMSPQSLRRRMAHGNIYQADQIDAALSRYFREGNLAALRELALLWLADRVDEGLERYRDAHGIESTWTTRERLVVALTGGPESPALLRRAARIASRTTGGEWLAVYVAQRDGLASVSPDRLASQATMTAEMGGSFHTVVSDDVATGILSFARAENASQILIGASRRGRVAALLRPGVGERVIAESGDVDVHIVGHDYSRRASGSARAGSDLGRRRRAYGFGLGVVGPFLLGALLAATADLHGLPTEAMLMMSLVVATAIVGGLVPALVAALLSGLLLNYLFTAPTHTLTISDPENVLAIIVFLIVGVAVASVVDLAARRTKQAITATAEADALAVLSYSLVRAGENIPQLLAQACEVFGMRGAAIVRHDGGVWTTVAAHGDAPASLEESDVDVPIDDQTSLVLRGRRLEASDRRLVTAYAAHAAVIRDREQAADDAVRTRELAAGNRTRTALLAAVSHDLRSPLAAIKAAVSSLRNGEITWSSEDEAELLRTIEESSDRLDALVGNLLDMSRLQTGAINPLLADVDLASAARWAIRPLDGADRISVCVDARLAPAYADAGLLERVIANVSENALKHTRTSVEIHGSAFTDAHARPRVTLRIVDHGAGVPVGSFDRLFAPFQRLDDVPHGDGIGLGLAVARGLAEAMNGELTAEDTPGGGLTLVIDLPQSAELGPAGEPRKLDR